MSGYLGKLGNSGSSSGGEGLAIVALGVFAALAGGAVVVGRALTGSWKGGVKATACVGLAAFVAIKIREVSSRPSAEQIQADNAKANEALRVWNLTQPCTRWDSVPGVDCATWKGLQLGFNDKWFVKDDMNINPNVRPDNYSATAQEAQDYADALGLDPSRYTIRDDGYNMGRPNFVIAYPGQ